MLLSFVNMKLRDEFDSLSELCATLGIDEEELRGKLRSIDYEYIPELNQFR